MQNSSRTKMMVDTRTARREPHAWTCAIPQRSQRRQFSSNAAFACERAMRSSAKCGGPSRATCMSVGVMAPRCDSIGLTIRAAHVLGLRKCRRVESAARINSVAADAGGAVCLSLRTMWRPHEWFGQFWPPSFPPHRHRRGVKHVSARHLVLIAAEMICDKMNSNCANHRTPLAWPSYNTENRTYTDKQKFIQLSPRGKSLAALEGRGPRALPPGVRGLPIFVQPTTSQGNNG